jgi:two-component system NtrC family sensor kinase
MFDAHQAPSHTPADTVAEAPTSVARPGDRRLAHLLDETTSARLAAAGQLAAGLLHEVNNPLAVVLGNLEFARLALRDFLARDPARAGASELDLLAQLIGDAEHGAQRIVEVVSDLRPLSRSTDSHPSTFELGAAVRAALRVVRAQVQRVADLVLDLEPGLVVIGNAGQLTQAVLALVLDATEVMRTAGGAPASLVVRAQREHGRAVLRVTDSGPSIPEPLLPRLFDPLGTREAGGRAGLGPCVVREIVQRLGGTLEVASGAATGVTFTVSLPLAASRDGVGEVAA